MLPPIRYPLPTMVAVALASLLTWKGAEWTQDWRAEMAARLNRAVEGPPVPSSGRPQVVLGPITRRALLLRDDVVARSRPNGPALETLDRRMFVDVYDTWPDPGPITHVRIGNRKPIGWVTLPEALLWDTRLVVRVEGGTLSVRDTPKSASPESITIGTAPLPVLAWTETEVELGFWETDHPWSALKRRGWVRLSELPPERWGVWISQVELPILLRMALEGDPDVARLRAVLGRLADGRTWTRADVEAARPGLPAFVLAPNPEGKSIAGRLAEANARNVAEAAWSGLSFRALPMNELP